jgi:hypothetical protein
MAKTTKRGRQAALMTLQEVSEEKGPPYTTVRDLVIQGHLPRVTLGDSKRIWVRRADVERLMGGAA